MSTKPKKPLAEIVQGMSEEHRRMIAEGAATMHRFAAQPSFKHGKPHYKASGTAAAITHAKTKRGR
jgi:hypothetical protein